MNVHLHTLALAWLVKRLFAVEVLVCAHCAGKLHVVEIATEKAAIKRIIRNERRRRGERASEMEARGPPGGAAGTSCVRVSVRETE